MCSILSRRMTTLLKRGLSHIDAIFWLYDPNQPTVPPTSMLMTMVSRHFGKLQASTPGGRCLSLRGLMEKTAALSCIVEWIGRHGLKAAVCGKRHAHGCPRNRETSRRTAPSGTSSRKQSLRYIPRASTGLQGVANLSTSWRGEPRNPRLGLGWRAKRMLHAVHGDDVGAILSDAPAALGNKVPLPKVRGKSPFCIQAAMKDLKGSEGMSRAPYADPSRNSKQNSKR